IKSHALIQPPALETPPNQPHLTPRSRHLDLGGEPCRYNRRLFRAATVIMGSGGTRGKQAGWVGGWENHNGRDTNPPGNHGNDGLARSP
ncbi:hypothetical protein, partial [Acrocarpospora macrocephala]|uniref:hypothetical protein n=1 Tax=Acrocarpospora macrocephala TaxID=150177 RepID=UPI001C3FCB3A